MKNISLLSKDLNILQPINFKHQFGFLLQSRKDPITRKTRFSLLGIGERSGSGFSQRASPCKKQKKLPRAHSSRPFGECVGTRDAALPRRRRPPPEAAWPPVPRRPRFARGRCIGSCRGPPRPAPRPTGRNWCAFARAVASGGVRSRPQSAHGQHRTAPRAAFRNQPREGRLSLFWFSKAATSVF